MVYRGPGRGKCPKLKVSSSTVVHKIEPVTSVRDLEEGGEETC